jgi:hypothetical protein
MVSQLSALEYDGVRAVLGCPPRAAAVMNSQARALGELLQTVLGKPVQVQIREMEGAIEAPPVLPTPPLAVAPGTVPAGSTPGRSVGPVTVPNEIRDHPLIKRAVELFGARITGVQQAAPQSGAAIAATGEGSAA